MDPLRADCASCFGLCCVASAFTRSSDFALNKPAGTPCPNLLVDFQCRIHSDLRARGFPGCTTFDCLGAGQKVAQVTYGGVSWREAPETAEEMFQVFGIMRQLHEILWYLTEVSVRAPASEVSALLTEVEALTLSDATTLVEADVEAIRERVRPLLVRVSEEIRSGYRGRRDRRKADLIGASLRGVSLRGANLRGAYLIGTDLRDADLRDADFLGTDLRTANLSGANLDGALFLTQFQLNAALGDATTRFPETLSRPTHWSH
jgi:hypothetical protein